MKPTSPLSLFLFLTLTTALPIPSPLQGHETCTGHGTCTSSSGRPTLKSIAALWHFSSSNPGSLFPHSLSLEELPQDKQDSRISFEPSHTAAQLSSHTNDDASQAFSSNSPLSSTYLLSLNTKVESDAEPKDSNRMRGSSHTAYSKSAPGTSQPYHDVEEAMEAGSKIGMGSEREQMGHAVFEEGYVDSPSGKGKQKFYRNRECSDVIVVAIVLLFLVVVMVVEVLEGVIMTVKSVCNIGEGRIRLEELTEKSIEKPFQLQPAPRTRELMGVRVVEEAA